MNSMKLKLFRLFLVLILLINPLSVNAHVSRNLNPNYRIWTETVDVTRIKNDFPRYDFKKASTLTFEEPDLKTFRNLALSIEALEKGGNLPCILNAANEIAVYAFLKNRIGFIDMTEVVERTMHKIPFLVQPTLNELLTTDEEARIYAAEIINM